MPSIHIVWAVCALLVACGSSGGGSRGSDAAGAGATGSSGSAGSTSAGAANGGSESDGGSSGSSTLGGAAAAGGSSGGDSGDTGGAANPPPATDRSRLLLGGAWKFIASNSLTGAEATAFDDSKWATVSVPHTWDSVNQVTKYSNSWYRLHVTVPAADLDKQHYFYFEGAFQVADVFVNGKHLGQHRGGYTRFSFDATSALAAGDNVLAVRVSNADCADCLPSVSPRLFKGYGGIYRKAWLVSTNRYHVATTDYASSGVYLTPSKVSAASAQLSEKLMLTNDSATDATFHVETVAIDPLGQPALTLMADVAVKANSTATSEQMGSLFQPQLWSPQAPNLYTARVTVSVAGKLVDALDEHFGLRAYTLTSSDFTLNGVSTRLRGVAKHQETEYHASAVTDAELTQDWNVLQELGVNFVRLVHYPHAQLEYDLADERGIMVWAENGHTNGDGPTPNGAKITREMVYQNWNHPSILFWSAGNEAGGGEAATTEYAGVAKMADPSRPTVYGSNGQTVGNVDFVFHNTYAGWYGGTIYDYLTAGDHWISETGGGMVIGTHTADPFAMKWTVNSYEPEEYGMLFDEVRFDDLIRKPSHVPAFVSWSFREISDGKYKGLINSKGLLTYAGYKKNVFYHLQSLLSDKPVVHLVAPEYFLRSADPAKHGPVKAYSNAAALTLKVNGSTLSKLENNQYKHPNGTPIGDTFYWASALVLGENVLSADDGNGHTDSMTVYYTGTGTTLPTEPNAALTNLTASNGAAYFIDTPVLEQRPFYVDFDGTGDNTFDQLPAALEGASWIATRRQSDPAKRTDLAFDVTQARDLFILCTKQATVPAWITAAGFTDTNTPGQWRDNNLKLTATALYKRSVSAGTHINLASTAIDYVVLVK